MSTRTLNVDPFEIIQSIDEPLFVLNEKFAVVFANRAFDQTFGVSRADIEGRSVYEIGNGVLNIPLFRQTLEGLKNAGTEVKHFETEISIPQGKKTFIVKAGVMRRYGSSNEDQILVRFEDISEQLAAELSIREKSAAILELSTPITKIWDEILVLPMIGTLDAERANKMIEQLLDAISRERARSIIMDGTGITHIDETVATHIIKATTAVKLLGSQVIMTGVKPEVAMMMVKLGIDLKDIVTRATLQEGVQYALDSRGYMVVSKSSIMSEDQTFQTAPPRQNGQNSKPTIRIVNPYREP
ncbi:MAG TPA: STAS domain-containing protein [Methanospirillum sp.]|uniref:STAS domain-containing protein n=1 Tax=Methanospirillum sp. TaxID=45200 RepID=UPI002C519378|nr:STAS domain-containing protein [Methanospirillum sp.]HOJ97073.1 STAS domain-containing protein [Methanospirillum sp.]HPP76968.1 STAS domain-containing protein [Methanospirillum sp.]